MVFQVRKLYGTFEKRAPEHGNPGVVTCPCLTGWFFTWVNLLYLAPFPLGQDCPVPVPLPEPVPIFF